SCCLNKRSKKFNAKFIALLIKPAIFELLLLLFMFKTKLIVELANAIIIKTIGNITTRTRTRNIIRNAPIAERERFA
ncbi:unnamed protein product, partial [Rotaria sp. Silwood2]